MHNNYFFIKQIAGSLKEILQEATLAEAFWQEKGEVFFRFITKENEFYIKAHFASGLNALYFPGEVAKAKRNVNPIFQEISNKKVKGIIQGENERAFLISFEDDFDLIFKLFGDRSNLILCKNDVVVKLLNGKLKNDFTLNKNSIHKFLNLHYEDFINQNGDLALIPTLGNIRHTNIFKDYEQLNTKDKWQLIQGMMDYLENPEYYITIKENKAQLTLFKDENITQHFHNPLEAANAFYHAYFRYNFLEGRKKIIHHLVDSKIRYLEKTFKAVEQRLEQLLVETPPNQIADIIMANLHSIETGAQLVTLYDFYNDQNIQIKLKKNLSPQKFAETLYRKAKNRTTEFNHLEEQQQSRSKELEEVRKQKVEIDLIQDYKGLDVYEKKYALTLKAKQDSEEPVFRHFEFMGFQIYIGRSAENNDELTQKFARKNDLWLHAKDVQGSHVVIKEIPGKKFPKPVIEKAAAAAAYYSKRKNDSLCPVIFTEKKFVRKVKGAAKGSVKVEKETVIMVVPEDPLK